MENPVPKTTKICGLVSLLPVYFDRVEFNPAFVVFFSPSRSLCNGRASYTGCRNRHVTIAYLRHHCKCNLDGSASDPQFRIPRQSAVYVSGSICDTYGPTTSLALQHTGLKGWTTVGRLRSKAFYHYTTGGFTSPLICKCSEAQLHGCQQGRELLLTFCHGMVCKCADKARGRQRLLFICRLHPSK